MITVASGTAFSSIAQNFPSGLVGTISVKIFDSLGNTTVAASTANIRELVSGSGVYQKRISDVLAAGFYNIVWSSGNVYATEELQVTP